MSAEQTDGRSLPGRTIHGAYQDCLQARSDYQRAIGGPMEGAAHERLHDATAAYYEALRPLVSSANVTEKLWEDVELWPLEPIYHTIGYCPACGAQAPMDELEKDGIEAGADMCPNCRNAVVEAEEMPKVDPETGQMEYRWLRGLESLNGIWDRVQEVPTEYESGLGPYESTRREAVLLEPGRLMTVARKLDEALERLDLHAEVDDDVRITEFDNEDLEDYTDRLEEIVEEWGGQESLAEKEGQ